MVPLVAPEVLPDVLLFIEPGTLGGLLGVDANLGGGAVPALAALERTARDAGRGLWKCGPTGVVRPDLWRAMSKQEKAVYLGVCDW